MTKIELNPDVVAECKRLDQEARALERAAFGYILLAFAIYFICLGLTIADKIPAWLMYLVTAATIIRLWYSNRLTTRAHRMQYKSFKLIDAEIMRLLKEYKNG